MQDNTKVFDIESLEDDDSARIEMVNIISYTLSRDNSSNQFMY